MEPSKGELMGEGTGGSEESESGQHPKPMPPASLKSCDITPPEPQPARTLKRTALKLFGGRTLPSFFGGRKKCEEKGLKKWIRKSKTHDGISKVSWEDGRKVGDIPARDFEYHSHKDKVQTSCQSSHATKECLEGGTSSRLPSPGGDHKPFWEKSLFLPRPKRGLKGLFRSLRCPRKYRGVELVKHDTFELSGDVHENVVHAAESRMDQPDTNGVSSLTELSIPAINVRDILITTCEVTKEAIVSESGLPKTDGDNTKSFFEDQVLTGADKAVEVTPDVPNVNHNAPYTDIELNHISVDLDYEEREQPSIHTPPDQISVVSVDACSLKSFDSLTGCGDVIAEQNDDSIADKSDSGEKNRSAGKRNSCCVNYQGGGEEMATPEEVDKECLRGLLESEAVIDVDKFPRVQQGVVKCNVNIGMTSVIPSPPMDNARSASALQVDTEVFLVPGDVLTPQSDQQGSVPNSDEGYYDSTTPGPDDEVVDDVGRTGNARLPRDSYSGDALYELYESEHSVITPPLEGKSSLENHFPRPDTLEFLCLMLQSRDAKRTPSLAHKSSLLATEEVRLDQIQPKMSCGWQGKQMPVAKKGIAFGKGRFSSERSSDECILNVNKKQACLKEEPWVSCTRNTKTESVLYGSRSFKDANKNGQNIPCIRKMTDNHPWDIPMEDVVFSASVPKMSHPVQDLTSYLEQGCERVVSENQKMQPSDKVDEGLEHKTVCFSQALVDFTKHSKLLNNVSLKPVGPEQHSFAQNVHALPAMVTFDVFDIENEGECDRQMEMEIEVDIIDEDAESPYEISPYESYLQKDAFAECDDRMLNDFDQSLFFSNTFGVASLPRCFGLAGVGPPVPAPLTLKRRSRSLDTDTLEFEMSNMYSAQTEARPLKPLPRSKDPSSTIPSLLLKMNGLFASPKMGERAGKSWQPQTSDISMPCLTSGEKEIQVQSVFDRDQAKSACSQTNRHQPQYEAQATKCKTRPKVSKCTVQEKWVCNSTLPAPGQMARSSHLPVPCGPPQPDTELSGPLEEGICKEPSPVTVLEDRMQENSSKKYFSKQLHNSYQQHPKIRPIGVTRGMPHFLSDAHQISKPAIFNEHREITSKGRKELGVSLPTGTHKRAV